MTPRDTVVVVVTLTAHQPWWVIVVALVFCVCLLAIADGAQKGGR